MNDGSPVPPHSGRHGASVPRGLDVPGGPSPRGRFGRMFPFLPVRDIGIEGIDTLIEVIGATAGDESRAIPAGYTYLGQFVDHDITFDPSSSLDKINDPLALVNFRTPRLDLDSVYGAGPADQPFLYEWPDRADRGVKLLIGRNPPTDAHGVELAAHDLQRNAQGRALIGDARNDENAIVSQLHLLFIRVHNKVVDCVRKDRGLEGPELFREAQRVVRWHYQWVVVHDFLRRVVGCETLDSVLAPAGEWPPVRRRFYAWEGEPFIPVEFSGAAYRFGHSMVRRSYKPRRDSPPAPLFRDDENAYHLGGFRRLRKDLEIRWEMFFALSDPDGPQMSREIDANIAAELTKLPADVAPERKLARLNMLRARALELPAGPDVARAMGQEPLGATELLLDKAPATTTPELLEALERGAPLWFYILCEAAARGDGEHLGPVGGRIVAEVLVGLLEGDPHSYLCQAPAWKPELPGTDGTFAMADLVRFAERDE